MLLQNSEKYNIAYHESENAVTDVPGFINR